MSLPEIHHLPRVLAFRTENKKVTFVLEAHTYNKLDLCKKAMKPILRLSRTKGAILKTETKLDIPYERFDKINVMSTKRNKSPGLFSSHHTKPNNLLRHLKENKIIPQTSNNSVINKVGSACDINRK